MPLTALSEDEFRVLAYIRAYADNRAQHIDPGWVQEQLELSLERMQIASRKLTELGLAEYFEFQIPDSFVQMHPEVLRRIYVMPRTGKILRSTSG